MMINNRQRLNYILDWLAEPFPEEAQLKSCACGTDPSKADVNSVSRDDRFPSKRELLEESLLEALKTQSVENQTVIRARTLKDALDALPDSAIGNLLISMPLELVDRHLNDLSLFADPTRPTDIEEIKQWDQRHAKDFLFLS